MRSIFCQIDDKHVPLYRVLWISDLPHFCGEDDCLCEGQYEIRLENDESVWATRVERDSMLKAIEEWQGGLNEDWR
jgi:hypothetical protein